MKIENIFILRKFIHVVIGTLPAPNAELRDYGA